MPLIDSEAHRGMRSDLVELVDAIRVVARGTSLVLPDLTRRLIASHAPSRARGAAALPELTGREADVLRLVAGGVSDAGIATELYPRRGAGEKPVSRGLLK